MSHEKIIVSFLGTGNYQPCRYQHNGEICETAFFVYALHTFYPEYRAKVVLTKGARDKHYTTLSTLDEPSGEVFSFDTIDIADGKNENELWDMFANLAEAIPEHAHVIIDVTHGFRTQPMLALAAGVYLRTTKGVTIERIVYGAYDARDQNNTAPVFDLTSFLDLIDWSISAGQFIDYGNARPLSDLLKGIHRQTHKNQAEYKAEGLHQVGESLAKFTSALATNRPQEALEHAEDIPKTIDKARNDLEHLSQTKPFGLLLDQINERINPFAKAEHDLFTKEGFAAQTEMLMLYLETEQYAQAITLAREALVSKACYHFNLSDEQNIHPLNHKQREEAESQLNQLSQKLRSKQPLTGSEHVWAQHWQNISNLRNDINHAGMRKDAQSAKKVIENIKTACDKVSRFIIS